MIYCCLHPLCHPQYFFCLLLIFTIELVAGVLAFVYYQRVSDHLCVSGRQLLQSSGQNIVRLSPEMWFYIHIYIFYFFLLRSWIWMWRVFIYLNTTSRVEPRETPLSCYLLSVVEDLWSCRDTAAVLMSFLMTEPSMYACPSRTEIIWWTHSEPVDLRFWLHSHWWAQIYGLWRGFSAGWSRIWKVRSPICFLLLYWMRGHKNMQPISSEFFVMSCMWVFCYFCLHPLLTSCYFRVFVLINTFSIIPAIFCRWVRSWSTTWTWPWWRTTPSQGGRTSHQLWTGCSRTYTLVSLALCLDSLNRLFNHLSLPPQFKCCGSNSSADWLMSRFVTLGQAEGRVVPDSCCKTSTPLCGRRDHPSNIYKVEVSAPPADSILIGFVFIFPVGLQWWSSWLLQGGCVSKLERFLADHLLVVGAVGIGVAFLQVKRHLSPLTTRVCFSFF